MIRGYLEFCALLEIAPAREGVFLMMTASAIRKKLEALLKSADKGRDEATLVFFGSDGSQDSVTALKLIMQIENEFGITVEDEEIAPENFAHIPELVQYIEKKLKT